MPEELPGWLWALLTVSLHDLWSWWVSAPVWLSVPLAVLLVGAPLLIAELYQH